jgi:hypothetical protein
MAGRVGLSVGEIYDNLLLTLAAVLWVVDVCTVSSLASLSLAPSAVAWYPLARPLAQLVF